MKYLFKLLMIVFTFAIVRSGYSQSDSVTNTLTNFNIINGTKFSFDIYTLRTTASSFIMGNSSYIVKYTSGTLTNPVISNVNPKYTLGGVSNSYDEMISQRLSATRTAVQLMYVSGPGENISDVPGSNGYGERIATVTLDILQSVSVTVQWDVLNSAVVSNTNGSAYNSFEGIFTGVLPVELASFTSLINLNSVSLNWSTSSEVNNNGFDIERKSANENSNWNKVAFVDGKGNSEELVNYSYTDKNLEIGKYNYRLKQIDFNGNFKYYDLENEVVVGIPVQFELSQNYPNPFNPTTKINFTLPADTKVSLSIYDVSGRLVSTLINNEFKQANYYSVSFNGANLSSGTYFYSIRTDNNNETKKMILIK
ncbi:MAG TPA: T9SS type A sorting domain-containing protein [Ignavibacteria bacterium]|nr:T9SS type A sorting domain-containing protein [Ignavibacteria bacterium]